MNLPDAVDVVVVGAGPAGLCVAIEAARAGMHPVHADRALGVGRQPPDDELAVGAAAGQDAGVRAIEPGRW